MQNDLDLESVEVISGLHRLHFMVLMFSGNCNDANKNAFDYKNLQIKLKGGNRQMADVQVRYANAFGKKKCGRDVFGFKVSVGILELKIGKLTIVLLILMAISQQM